MGIRTLLKRIEKAEEALKAQSIFSPDCICFPDKEQPFFCQLYEEGIAAKVKCPLHGDRFKQPICHIYVSKWLRDKQAAHLWTHHSEQYRKAWFASFPPELWPAEEEMEGGKLFLRLKDGTRLQAYEPNFRKGDQTVLFTASANFEQSS